MVTTIGEIEENIRAKFLIYSLWLFFEGENYVKKAYVKEPSLHIGRCRGSLSRSNKTRLKTKEIFVMLSLKLRPKRTHRVEFESSWFEFELELNSNKPEMSQAYLSLSLSFRCQYK